LVKISIFVKKKNIKEKYLIDNSNFCGKCPECDHDLDVGLNGDNEPTRLKS